MKAATQTATRIAFCPNFLVVAATSMAALTPPEVAQESRRHGRRRWDADGSLAFLQRAGFWSHCRIAAQTTAWPFAAARSLVELEEEAESSHTLREDARIGAIALVARARTATLAPRWVQCGIVTDVRGRTPYPQRRGYLTEVVWGVLDEAGRVHGISTGHAFEASRGDRFIHWWRHPGADVLRAAA